MTTLKNTLTAAGICILCILFIIPAPALATTRSTLVQSERTNLTTTTERIFLRGGSTRLVEPDPEELSTIKAIRLDFCTNNLVVEIGDEIIFASPQEIDLALRIYRPMGCTKKIQTVFIPSGSGFSHKDPEIPVPLVQEFTKRGYAVVVAAHRDKFDAQFPAQIHDLRGAIRYIRAHANDLDLDTDKLAIIGSSSSGILASIITTTQGDLYFEGLVGGNTEYSSDVSGAIIVNGSYTLNQLTNLSSGALNASKIVSGCTPQDTLATCPQIADLSLQNYTDSADPNFLLLHGEDDTTVPITQSEELAPFLAGLGILYDYIPVPDVPHSFRDAVINSIETVEDFLIDLPDTVLHVDTYPLADTYQ